MDFNSQTCPECKHVLMWSVGKSYRTLWDRLTRRHVYRTRNWHCSVGSGADWTVPFCGCKNAAHVYVR